MEKGASDFSPLFKVPFPIRACGPRSKGHAVRRITASDPRDRFFASTCSVRDLGLVARGGTPVP
jgi:hypothetical protein